ncbi:MAG TPA: hypothetical protein VFM70_04555 [Salinimicrobium sp.]|nr:hypothetical protein [Salinimicrobium sp.]
MALHTTDKSHQDYLTYLDLREKKIPNVEIAQKLGYSKKQFGYLISHYEFRSNLEYHLPEREGNYHFGGNFYLTQGVMDSIAKKEIADIFTFIKRLVKQHDGIDYLQTFYSIDNDCKLFIIDNLSKEMIESGKYDISDNYFTLMLASEY